MDQFYYFSLLIVSMAVPLLWSFESEIRFFLKWPRLLPAIAVMMLVFIPWDIIFTAKDIWYFNPAYVTGIYLAGLPLEEWLFFLVIPYCVVFSYEVIRYFFPGLRNPGISLTVAISLSAVFLLTGIMNTDRLYTLTVMVFTSLMLLLQTFMGSHKRWLSHFFITYIIILVPFILVNGALTGAFTQSPVVGYDDTENLGIRLITIPVEDAVYLMGMMLLVHSVYDNQLLSGKTRKK